MPMARHNESLGGGYVNTREASLLGEGELSDGLNMTYRPYSTVIRNAAPLSGTANVVDAQQDVIGLHVLQFSDETEFMFAQVGTSYYASAGLSGAFGAVGAAITAGTSVDVATYNNRHYVFNGANANRVLYLNGSTKTMRAHGVSALTVPPAVSVGAGNWTLETGVYEYWATELVPITEGSSTYWLESDFTGSPSVVNITAASSSVIISRHVTLANSSATKWRIYRSVGPRVSDGVTLFPVGVLIKELPIATLVFVDGLSSDTGWKRPATVATTGAAWGTTTGITAGTQGDGTAATYASNTASTLTAYGYSFSTSEPITGIKVFIRAKIANPNFFGLRVMTVALSQDDGSTYSDERGIPFGKSDSYLGAADSAACVVGGETDTWGENSAFWTSTAINGANKLRVRVTVPANAFTLYGTMSIDDIDVRIFYGGSVSEPLGTFPYFSLSVDGASSSGSMLSVPPTSSTGAIFEDSLVVNDVNNPGLIRYSPAGLPEYFPSLYYMRLDVGKAEKITAIRAIGGRLIVTTLGAVYRVNYLPRTSDSSFDRGRPVELICSDAGVYAPFNITRFSSPVTGRPMLAMLTTRGVMASDGFDMQPIVNDFSIGSSGALYANTAESDLAAATIANDAPRSALQIAYGLNSLGTAVYRIEAFYHPTHLKPGNMFKCSVPIEMTSASGQESPKSMATARSGIMYVGTSSQSTTDPGSVLKCDSTNDSSLSSWGGAYVTSRMIFPQGVGREVKINSVYLLDTTTNASSTNVAMVLTTGVSNHANQTFSSVAVARPSSSAVCNSLRFDVNTSCEGVKVKFSPAVTYPTYGWDSFVVEYEHLGHVEQGP